MTLTNKDFVHTHVHTEHSSFDGLAKIGDLVLSARKMGFRALACTDHGNVAGWVKFYQECKKKKDKNDQPLLDDKGNPLSPIKPLLGCEFYLARHHELKDRHNQPDARRGNRHILLLAKNQKGYENLCALSQRSWTHGQFYDPRIDLDLLSRHSDGLICQSACLSSVINNNILNGRIQQARKAATVLKDLFGRDFFLEVMFHGIEEESVVIPEVLKIGNDLNIPVVASNDCHYIRKEQAASHEVLMAMSMRRCVKDPKHYSFPYDEFYLKSAQDMAVIFGKHPELLSNTLEVADRIEDFLKLGGMRLPRFDVAGTRKHLGEEYFRHIEEWDWAAICKDVKGLNSDDRKFEESYKLLVDLVGKGMIDRGWSKSDKHLAVLKKELGDVRVAWESNRMDFATYFLIVWDYIDFARRKGIPTGPGRGSGYASVILHALKICYGIDPLRYNLIWERFLGFDIANILLDSDWGFGEVSEAAEVLVNETDVDEEREVEHDQGGVDRY